MFNIVVSLLRGKLVSMFLGPEGMGISSLYTSSANTLQQFSGLGLNLAFVKEISARKDDADALPQLIDVAIRLIVFTSLLGGVICFLLAPLLSLWTFGTADYSVGFMFLALSVALSVASAGYLSILQGLGAVKRLAKASLVGGLTGLLVGVPLYYFFGNAGIVPSLIVLSLATFIFYYVSYRQVSLSGNGEFEWRRHKGMIFRLMRTGSILMAGGLAGTFTSYVINLFVREFGSIQDVGLFQAANSLTNQYVGVIISALAMDYFPRLSAAKDDADKFNMVVNRQIEIVCLIATPLVILLILTAPLVIEILLTAEFASIVPLMRWMGLGVLIQLICFPIGYVFIARNGEKLYFWLEVVFSNILWMSCSMFFYWQYSLIGLGVSLVVRSFIDNSVCYAFIRHYYGLHISAGNVRRVAIALTVAGGAFVLSFHTWGIMYVIPFIALGSCLYSVLSLRRIWNN